jgi:hypothetical protein
MLAIPIVQSQLIAHFRPHGSIELRHEKCAFRLPKNAWYEVTMSKEPRPRKRSLRRRPKEPIADSTANFEDPKVSFMAWLLERFTLEELMTDGQHRATARWWSDLLTSEDD